mgnify:CR=1 FL=1
MSDEAAPENELGPSVPAGAVSRELLIINKRGLHARGAGREGEALFQGKPSDRGYGERTDLSRDRVGFRLIDPDRANGDTDRRVRAQPATLAA